MLKCLKTIWIWWYLKNTNNAVALRIKWHATSVTGAHADKEHTIPAHTWASRFVSGHLSSEKARILPSLGFMKMKPLSLSLSAVVLQPPNSMQVEMTNLLGFSLIFLSLQDSKNSVIISSKASRVGAPINTSSIFFSKRLQHFSHLRFPSERKLKKSEAEHIPWLKQLYLNLPQWQITVNRYLSSWWTSHWW